MGENEEEIAAVPDHEIGNVGQDPDLKIVEIAIPKEVNLRKSKVLKKRKNLPLLLLLLQPTMKENKNLKKPLKKLKKSKKSKSVDQELLIGEGNDQDRVRGIENVAARDREIVDDQDHVIVIDVEIASE